MGEITRTRTGWRTPVRRRLAATAAAAGLALAGLGVISVAQAAPENPFSIEGLVPDEDAFFFDDGQGNMQELGPINGNGTKLGVIHSATPPMLGTTNPNAQVDLRGIWLDTQKDADGNTWLYFAWERDSNRGSGVIMYEFQQDPEPAACDYTEGPPYTDLIAGCNPWANRQPDDFVIVWDQSGNTIDIILRRWADPDGGAWAKGEPLVLSAGESLTGNGNAFAEYSEDKFFGEAAVNLTATVFSGTLSCTTIGNVIPGTVTGNSDTADYKDTVLADVASYLTISNCGSVTVTKETDPADGTGNFDYALSRSGGQDIRYAEDGYTGEELTSATGTLTEDGDFETVVDLIAGANYTLAETFGENTPYDLTSIVCTTEDDTEYIVFTTEDGVDAVDFPVIEGETTDCVITNTQKRGTLVVQKVLTNNNGGELEDYSDFFFTVTGDYAVPNATNQAFDDDGVHSFSVIAGTYSVVEDNVPIPGYTTTYANDYNEVADCANLVVAPNATVTCTITNNDDPASPTGTTVQSWVLHDELTITGIRAGGSPAASVTFRLYSDEACTVQVGSDETDTSIDGDGKAATSTGVTVTSSGTYYWTAQYSGDSFNNGFTTACGDEITQILAKDAGGNDFE